MTWLFPRASNELHPIQLGAVGSGPVKSLIARAQHVVGIPPSYPILSDHEMVEASFSMRREQLGMGDDPSERLAESGDPTEQPGLEIELALHRNRSTLFGPEQHFRMVLWTYGRQLRTPGDADELHMAFASPISHRGDRYLGSRTSKVLRRRDKKDRMVDLLRHLDPNIADLMMVTPEEPDDEYTLRPQGDSPAILHIAHSSVGLIPVHAMGDGVRRALHFAALLADVGPGGVLLIEEIESGMHSQVLRDTFAWLGKACIEAGVQLFATTHSLEAVDAMLAAVPHTHLALYRLSEGRVRRYDGDLLRTIRYDLGQEVR